MLCGLTLLKTVQLSGLVQEGSSHAQEAGNEQPDEFVVCSDHTDFVIILKRNSPSSPSVFGFALFHYVPE